jgi:NAD(P)H-nitrite reductase large subunit
MRQIGRELEREQGVIEVEAGPNILAQGCTGSKLKQATMVVRELELSRRAQHALALNTTKLADLDQKGFAIVARW